MCVYCITKDISTFKENIFLWLIILVGFFYWWFPLGWKKFLECNFYVLNILISFRNWLLLRNIEYGYDISLNVQTVSCFDHIFCLEFSQENLELGYLWHRDTCNSWHISARNYFLFLCHSFTHERKISWFICTLLYRYISWQYSRCCCLGPSFFVDISGTGYW